MTRSDARMSSKAPRMAKLSCVEGKVFGARRADPRWPRPWSEVIIRKRNKYINLIIIINYFSYFIFFKVIIYINKIIIINI